MKNDDEVEYILNNCMGHGYSGCKNFDSTSQTNFAEERVIELKHNFDKNSAMSRKDKTFVLLARQESYDSTKLSPFADYPSYIYSESFQEFGRRSDPRNKKSFSNVENFSVSFVESFEKDYAHKFKTSRCCFFS